MRWRLAFIILGIAGCAASPIATPVVVRDVDVLLLGEQHDAVGHQFTHRAVIASLASQGRLAAVAVEMADAGRSTVGLAPDASEEQVRAALGWDASGWPWPPYAPAVMAAVRAGVPVAGANLPAARLRAAMADASLDTLLPATALQAQRDAIRDGHCGLLPEPQIAPMARVQIARDRMMAATLSRLAQPGKVVVLLSGGGHANPDIGVPVHLPPMLKVQAVLLPPVDTGTDYCAQLRQSLPASPRDNPSR